MSVLKIKPDGSYYYEAIPSELVSLSKYVTQNYNQVKNAATTNQTATKNIKQAINNAKEAITAPLTAWQWIQQNWKIVLIGVVALLILLKD